VDACSAGPRRRPCAGSPWLCVGVGVVAGLRWRYRSPQPTASRDGRGYVLWLCRRRRSQYVDSRQFHAGVSDHHHVAYDLDGARANASIDVRILGMAPGADAPMRIKLIAGTPFAMWAGAFAAGCSRGSSHLFSVINPMPCRQSSGTTKCCIKTLYKNRVSSRRDRNSRLGSARSRARGDEHGSRSTRSFILRGGDCS
jgi:hypothetical protein